MTPDTAPRTRSDFAFCLDQVAAYARLMTPPASGLLDRLIDGSATGPGR